MEREAWIGREGRTRSGGGDKGTGGRGERGVERGRQGDQVIGQLSTSGIIAMFR